MLRSVGPTAFFKHCLFEIIAPLFRDTAGGIVIVKGYGVIPESGFQISIVIGVTEIIESIINGVIAPLFRDAQCDIMVVKGFGIISESGFQVGVLIGIKDIVKLHGACGGGCLCNGIGRSALFDAVCDIVPV